MGKKSPVYLISLHAWPPIRAGPPNSKDAPRMQFGWELYCRGDRKFYPRSGRTWNIKWNYQISLFFYILFPFRLRMERKPQALLTVYLRLESMASFRNCSTICRVSTVQCHINYYLLMAKSLTLRQTGDKCNKTTAVALLHFYYAELSQVYHAWHIIQCNTYRWGYNRCNRG